MARDHAAKHGLVCGTTYERAISHCRAAKIAAKTNSQHVYEIRPQKDRRGVDLISDALPFGRLWYAEPNAIINAIGYAKHYSRSEGAVIHVYDDAGNVIEKHEHKCEFKEW